jgi:hypothetical protein
MLLPVVRATEWLSPASMLRQLVAVPTWVGVVMIDGVPVPAPTWPASFRPHAHNRPSTPSAIVWLRPALTACHTVLSPMRTGRFRVSSVPSPSWPELFRPQAHSDPSVRMATV